MATLARRNVHVVIVSWNPDVDRLALVVDVLLPQVDAVTIVDNGSRNIDKVTTLAEARDKVGVIALAENRGIAAGLNVGIQEAFKTSPGWIMTMDQDSLVDGDAIERISNAFSMLDSVTRERCGVLALRPHPLSSSIPLTRYAERLLTVRDRGAFSERVGVITSGNLVRATVLEAIAFNESLFIDQVDFDFCHDVRRRGYLVLEQKESAMAHLLGERVADAKRDHPYENAQRFYYIVRNSTYLVLRGRLPIRFYFLQAIIYSGSYLSVNGVSSILHCVTVIFRGFFDGLLGRLGRREYAVLTRGRR